MKRSVLILAFVVIMASIASLASGKVMRRKLGIFQGTVPETETLAPETMEFVYDYSCCVDTTENIEDNVESENMLLQIGPDGLSKFSSYRNLTVDSIILRSSEEQLRNAAMEGKLSNGDYLTIFKNHPQGKLTHTEKVCMDWFAYEEDMPEFDWEMMDSTVNVLGYECQGARCNFRGRDWTVFFSEEIPIADGPWKLHGLPGLIMKAEDGQGHYSFECIGIKSKADRPITMYKVPYNRMKRKEFYDTKHRYDVNPFGYYEATTGGHVNVRDESGNIMLDSYDPIDLGYDYLERDWRK